jgi:hypothetical protein
VTIEDWWIHDCYAHDIEYSAFYLGNNVPSTYDNPWVDGMKIEDCIVERTGAYGMVIKGIKQDSDTNYLKDNIVRDTGQCYLNGWPDWETATAYSWGDRVLNDDGNIYTCISGHTSSASDEPGVGGSWEDKWEILAVPWSGAGLRWGAGETADGIECEISGNRTEDTYGPGLTWRAGGAYIHDNEFLGPSLGQDEYSGGWDNGGITAYGSYTDDSVIEDNIILKPWNHAIYFRNGATGGTMNRNKIGEAGGDECADDGGTASCPTEGTGDDVNIVAATMCDASFNFTACSDDDYWGNEDFTGANAPIISNVQPQSQQECGAVTISLDTNENATCKYDLIETAYGDMGNTFSTTGTTSHSQSVSPSCDAVTTYNIVCRDGDDNDSALLELDIDVATEGSTSPPPVSMGRSGAVSMVRNTNGLTITR